MSVLSQNKLMLDVHGSGNDSMRIFVAVMSVYDSCFLFFILTENTKFIKVFHDTTDIKRGVFYAASAGFERNICLAFNNVQIFSLVQLAVFMMFPVAGSLPLSRI